MIDPAQTPLVSVVIPVHNGRRYVREAIESVRGQTYAPTELIVVDDGSTDDSRDIVASFSDIKLMEQPNRGVATARNVGIAGTSGELIAFLDQDDAWVPEKLAWQVQAMTDDPDLGYVTGAQVMYLDEGGEAPSWLRAQLLDVATPHPQPGTVLIRRDLLALIGGFDESFAVASDAEWFFRANDLGVKTRALPQVVLRKRIHTENELSRVKDNQAELLRAARLSVVRKRGRPRTERVRASPRD